MRVALLTFNAQAGDAIGNQVAAKLAFFLERGAEVRVFVQSDRDLHPAMRTYARTLSAPTPRGEAWRFLASADLVVVEYGHYYTLLELLPLLADARPRILLDYHGVTPPELWGPHNRETLEQGVRQRGLVWWADGVLVHSRFTELELRQQCVLPAERLHRLGFPIDLRQWRPGETSGRLREQLGLQEAYVLLFVGRLAANKRVPLLVEALARLRDVTPAVHVVVVGDVSDLYAEEARRCEEQARELGVADRLHFLGRLQGEALRDAYHAADLFVTPSLWESFCIPVIEAMACGVPVVAARATALPETVARAGLTFTPEDADDLARQVRRLLPACIPACPTSDDRLRERLRRRGLERAAQFDTAVWQTRFAAIVESVLDGGRRPPQPLVEVRPCTATRTVAVGVKTVLLAVRVHNRGTHPLVAEGPGRTVLRCGVTDEQGNLVLLPAEEIPLPDLVVPGRTLRAAVPVPVPDAPGVYRVGVWAERVATHPAEEGKVGHEAAPFTTSLRLLVTEQPAREAAPLFDAVHSDLAEAHRLQRLPEDYTDVTQGLLASWKRWIKRKLLGNFKHAYVDVLSRQQSACNRQLLSAVQELADCCATLDHAVRVLRERLDEVAQKKAKKVRKDA